MFRFFGGTLHGLWLLYVCHLKVRQLKQSRNSEFNQSSANLVELDIRRIYAFISSYFSSPVLLLLSVTMNGIILLILGTLIRSLDSSELIWLYFFVCYKSGSKICSNYLKCSKSIRTFEIHLW